MGQTGSASDAAVAASVPGGVSELVEAMRIVRSSQPTEAESGGFSLALNPSPLSFIE